ncbi:MAG: SH3 domain-containing protein [Chloroflexi bacterium]|nr:SH3 domain-containing protein [Chloroflexota bacterium]
MRRLLWCLVLLVMLVPALATAQDYPPQVQKALDDLNARLGLELTLSDFNWRFSKNIYPDASLGCPQPGTAYAQVQTPGFQVQLDVQGLTWDYRVSNDLSQVTLCSPLATPTPSPQPTYPPPTYIIPTGAPGSTATPTFCPNAPAPRLTVGSLAAILPDVANIVRQAPGEGSGFLGELPVGRQVYVLDGPRCASDMAWWYVADTQSRLIGWTSEGEVNDYWLEPVFITPSFPTPQPLPTLDSGGAGMAPTVTPQPLDTQVFRPTPSPTLPGFMPTPGREYPTNPSPFRPSPTTTLNFAPTVTRAALCAPNLPPRLIVGGSGRVTPGIPNNMRQGPGSSTQYVGEIPPGGVFTVLEGPSCASGMSWWKVNYNGTIGWTPEGIAPQYWIEPV